MGDGRWYMGRLSDGRSLLFFIYLFILCILEFGSICSLSRSLLYALNILQSRRLRKEIFTVNRDRHLFLGFILDDIRSRLLV